VPPSNDQSFEIERKKVMDKFNLDPLAITDLIMNEKLKI